MNRERSVSSTRAGSSELTRTRMTQTSASLAWGRSRSRKPSRFFPGAGSRRRRRCPAGRGVRRRLNGHDEPVARREEPEEEETGRVGHGPPDQPLGRRGCRGAVARRRRWLGGSFLAQTEAPGELGQNAWGGGLGRGRRRRRSGRGGARNGGGARDGDAGQGGHLRRVGGEALLQAADRHVIVPARSPGAVADALQVGDQRGGVRIRRHGHAHQRRPWPVGRLLLDRQSAPERAGAPSAFRARLSSASSARPPAAAPRARPRTARTTAVRDRARSGG